MKNKSEIILYQSKNGKTSIDVTFDKKTIWLDAHQLSELFQRDRTVIVKHIKNIYKTAELDKDSTCAKNAQVAKDGRIRQMNFYNLDMIISVGYRVNSIRGTQFRIWATNILKQHLIKGYSVNEKRLKELKQTIKLVENVIYQTFFINDNRPQYSRKSPGAAPGMHFMSVDPFRVTLN